MTVRDAAPRKIPVRRARGTVTGLVMEVSMMATPAVRETWCAAATTASSSELTTTRRTTAVRSQHLPSLLQSLREKSNKVSF